MTALAKIHAIRREVGFDGDDDWRDMLERVTGGRSSRGLTQAQSDAVIAELRRLGARGGPKASSKGSQKRLEGPYAAKLQALWLSCWNVGFITDRTDGALMAFAVRQAQVDHANWLRDHQDAVAVIEALKAMLARAGVNWGSITTVAGSEWVRMDQARVAVAQFRIICAPMKEPTSFVQFAQELTARHPRDLDRRDWIVVINNLGRLIRADQVRG